MGLMQAESAKSGNKLSFVNIRLDIHKEFFSLLNEIINIDINDIKCFLQHSSFTDNKGIIERTFEFSKITGIPSNKITFVKTSSVGTIPPIEICIFNKLMNEIMLSIMNNLRKILSKNKLSGKEKKLAEYFLSRLLTCDGTVIIRSKKGHFTPYIQVFDSPKLLEDYKKIFSNIGIDSKINEKYFSLRLLCDFDKTIYIYKIGAFENHKENRKKLLKCLINHEKSKSLKKLKYFKTNPLSRKNARKFVNNYWIRNKISKGYLKFVKRKYLLTKKGEDILEFMSNLNNKGE